MLSKRSFLQAQRLFSSCHEAVAAGNDHCPPRHLAAACGDKSGGRTTKTGRCQRGRLHLGPGKGGRSAGFPTKLREGCALVAGVGETTRPDGKSAVAPETRTHSLSSRHRPDATGEDR